MAKIIKENIMEIQLSSFKKSMSKVYFETSVDAVKNTSFSINEIKGMTLDIMKKVSEKEDTDLMNSVATTVEAWQKDKTKAWKSSLAKFSRVRQDVYSVYAGKTDKGNEFVIVLDDSACDDILDCTEFCFELAEKHDNIADFMILDREEYDDMQDFFSGFRKIYQRG